MADWSGAASASTYAKCLPSGEMAVCRKRLVEAITANAGSTGTRGWAPAAAARSSRVTGFMRNLSAYQSGTEVTEAKPQSCPVLPHPAGFADGASKPSQSGQHHRSHNFPLLARRRFQGSFDLREGAKILGVASQGRPIALLPR